MVHAFSMYADMGVGQNKSRNWTAGIVLGSIYQVPFGVPSFDPPPYGLRKTEVEKLR